MTELELLKAELKQLQMQVSGLMAWKNQREAQQLSYPVDDLSKAALGVVIAKGNGTKTLTQTVDTSGPTASVPAGYADTLILEFEGTQYEVPYL